ncbi:MAG: tripartite tricarboxylate transporter substrate binding protein [Deltaproteobacteria bacterium]|jgi:tripartite-type tricarboxylate transporter receptor subunit TctC|nr:tripartite tricarboxylate transporter substrate binding protein [Deltaproteobacteria bacterium]
MRVKACFTGIFMLGLVLCAGTALAAGYPDHPIQLIVNYGGGGGTDTSARILSKAAEKILNVPIAVSNRPGGLGTTGIIELKGRVPDGYNIGLATYAPLAIIPHQMDVPYTPADFDYILAYAQYQYGIFVNSKSPLNSLDDLVAEAKKKGGLSYAASGYPQPFAMRRIEELKGVTLNHMPVKSGPDLNAQLLGGHVDTACAIISDVLPLYKSGEIKILAVLNDERMPILPEIPTAKEQGYDVTLYSYMALAAPKGVPADRLEVLRQAYAQAHKDPEFQEVMQRMNIPAIYMSGPDFQQRVEIGYTDARRDLEAMGMLAK